MDEANFEDKFGQLTVEDAIALNEAARRTCEEDS